MGIQEFQSARMHRSIDGPIPRCAPNPAQGVSEHYPAAAASLPMEATLGGGRESVRSPSVAEATDVACCSGAASIKPPGSVAQFGLAHCLGVWARLPAAIIALLGFVWASPSHLTLFSSSHAFIETQVAGYISAHMGSSSATTAAAAAAAAPSSSGGGLGLGGFLLLNAGLAALSFLAFLCPSRLRLEDRCVSSCCRFARVWLVVGL